MNYSAILTGSIIVAFAIAAFWLVGLIVRYFSDMAVEAALPKLRRDLNTLKWTGADDGWELAIKAVRADILKRVVARSATTGGVTTTKGAKDGV